MSMVLSIKSANFKAVIGNQIYCFIWCIFQHAFGMHVEVLKAQIVFH